MSLPPDPYAPVRAFAKARSVRKTRKEKFAFWDGCSEP